MLKVFASSSSELCGRGEESCPAYCTTLCVHGACTKTFTHTYTHTRTRACAHTLGNKAWYTGRIVQQKADGTYSLHFCDGDSESGVRCENIRPLSTSAGHLSMAGRRTKSCSNILPDDGENGELSPSKRSFANVVEDRSPHAGWRRKKIARVEMVDELEGDKGGREENCGGDDGQSAYQKKEQTCSRELC